MNGGKIMIRISGCTAAITLFAALAIGVSLPVLAQADGSSDSHKPKLVKFDAPGATKETSAACAPSCGTFAYANNDRGVIVGFYTDPQVVLTPPCALPRAALLLSTSPAMVRAPASTREPLPMPSRID